MKHASSKDQILKKNLAWWQIYMYWFCSRLLKLIAMLNIENTTYKYGLSSGTNAVFFIRSMLTLLVEGCFVIRVLRSVFVACYHQKVIKGYSWPVFFISNTYNLSSCELLSFLSTRPDCGPPSFPMTTDDWHQRLNSHHHVQLAGNYCLPAWYHVILWFLLFQIVIYHKEI